VAGTPLGNDRQLIQRFPEQRGEETLSLNLLAMIVLLAFRSWLIVFAFAGPVGAFLSAFLAVGTPLWRYQAALHPFMIVVIVAALALSLQKITKLMPMRCAFEST